MSSAVVTAVLTADSAVPAGLVYVHDGLPGITRRRSGKGFSYQRPDGARLADAAHLQRIRALAIPPAYTQVWICTRANGHLQATGRDARGRKQYRYHADWHLAQDAGKYARLQAFAQVLPRIRAAVRRDLALAGPLQRDCVLAAVVRLLDTTLARVGNDVYARENGSYGLTTLRARHAQVRGSAVRLRFKGKSGVEHAVALDDARVARVVRRCQELPGQELFQYLDDAGERHLIDSDGVNAYLRAASGGDFTAKDFRTWHASVHALALARSRPCAPEASQAARRMAAKALLAEVAAKLGNTVAVCRKAYVHPAVLALLLQEAPPPACLETAPRRKAGLSAAECRFLGFLESAA
ncbi:DNA topoisomerase IB [Pseudorhodoferax sp. Leaf274]|uniref:DNA topoisomerase IB n=1 Tax=Pseudorhodoferax sp. Leaf274 TaxID=1736318 RepID=UPI000703138D|nr:DNA topoisomerase IB [Pseudorhodoferax sp. Leaf274]KQP45060.1 DNA topoisomerase [Pseudorhodoferax sp. Leaf274]